jgi:2-dehydro-3-deoxygluconokinase
LTNAVKPARREAENCHVVVAAGRLALTIRVASVGECMVELSQRDPGTFTLGFGGDTLNTAVYLARAAAPGVAVDYVTALGDDPYSQSMLEVWGGEGVGTAQVARLPGMLPGLYLIRVDEAGERRFFYYRSAAAARELFQDERTEAQLAALAGYDLVYFSLITLSILADPARDKFLDALQAVRRVGGRVAFDTNYRPAGWPDRAAAQAVVTRFMAETDIALPTADDEAKLFGDPDIEACLDRYRGLGVAELALKLGPEGCCVVHDGERRVVPVPERVQPVDTTAAGDSFNAGYLALRLAGRSPAEAALAGHRMAGAVVRHRGAIIPREATPVLFAKPA